MNSLGGQTQVAVATITVHTMVDLDPFTSKRKANDGSSLDGATKKRKKEPLAGTGKQKLVGEKQPGGLIITRVPPVRAASAQAPTSLDTNQQSLLPPSSQTLINGNHAKPQPKNPLFEVEPPFRTIGKGKGRDISYGTPEVEEDVRQMQSETEHLRSRSRPPDISGNHNSEYQLPPQTLPKTPKGSRDRIRELSQPIPLQETPQIARNKIMRADPGSARRKSSMSRGKRISSSFENTGVIAQPHTSVRASSFYKHIDPDLPEPQRAQQLLIWCSYRAMTELAEENTKLASSSKRNPKVSGKDPPPLSVDDAQLLKGVEEEVIRMLAEKQIDTSVYSPPGQTQMRQLKSNEQNIKNKAREVRFNAHIQRLKQEDEAWVTVGNSYNAYRQNVLADIKRRKEDLTSGRVKGKQRATAEEIALWDIHESDLPAHFLDKDGLQLARSIVAEKPGKKSPLSERLADLGLMADRLYLLSDSALQATRVAQTDLDRRFALLNLTLASRIQPILPAITPSTTVLSSYLPTTVSRPPTTTDPQDLLRALSRVDAERPQTQVGDAARRAAREVQRARDASNGLTERRLTGVPPPTPRKPPGTPRRATTPARGR